MWDFLPSFDEATSGLEKAMPKFLFEDKSTPVGYRIGKPPGYFRPESPPGPTIQEQAQGCALAGCFLSLCGICLVICSGILFFFL